VKVSPFILPAILAAAGPLAMADFTVSPVAVTLKPGEPFTFQVHPNDLKPRSWIISEGSGRNRGTLIKTDGKPGHYKYVAPKLEASETLELHITDPASGAHETLTVRIVVDDQRLELTSSSSSSEGARPAMTILAGKLVDDPEGRIRPHPHCFVEHLAMGDLHGHWLVTGNGPGIQAVSANGVVRALPGLPATVSAIATRPVGTTPVPEGEALVVFAEEVAMASQDFAGKTFGVQPYAILRILEPGGTTRLLAGMAGAPNLRDSRFRDGTGAEARFSRVVGLAMDPDGNVYVADAGANQLIRRVTPEGIVTTVAGQRGFFDQQARRTEIGQHCMGLDAVFHQITGLALDPATRTLYVADLGAIHRISPEGEVRTILGNRADQGHKTSPLTSLISPAEMNAFVSCRDIRVCGDGLLFTDFNQHVLRGLQLKTGVLGTFVGHPKQPLFRLGPLGSLSPSLPPEACAALQHPAYFASNSQGTCVVAQGQALLHLELKFLATPATEAKGEAKGEAKDESKEEAKHERK
jgi:hypothetical protein